MFKLNNHEGLPPDRNSYNLSFYDLNEAGNSFHLNQRNKRGAIATGLEVLPQQRV